MTNRLIHEKSPYLLQHAHNPVDWYPWGAEAFEKARRENKPVFLSIGYATCHWCHVMERESFEDREAAAVLNESFVCIKVDREERPDIDAVYMAVCQMVTGSGGWPLNVVLTPDKKPFFAGTYLPKHSRFGRAGIIEISRQIQSLWQNHPQRVTASAEGITDQLKKVFDYASNNGHKLGTEHLDRCFRQISRSYDPRFGGFDASPKFPTPHRLLFLLRQYQRTGNAHALEMVTQTLIFMRKGGLWDHVGFGFHRYSTDERWLLPHFEKMLYDQALLAMAYIDAYQITRDPLFAQTAEEILTYVLRDMTHDQGGFFSAEDADSEGEEGKFYIWRQDFFNKVANEVEKDIPWHDIFNLLPDGNFVDEATRQKSGENIMHLTRSWEQWAKTLDLEVSRLVDKWEHLRQHLFDIRGQREAPLKDDKILTDWNGLMIAALARGAEVFGDGRYKKAAFNAVSFIQSRLKDPDGRLLHRFRDGQAAIAAQAGDYAFLIMGLIDLYRATFAESLLDDAIELQKEMDAGFWDNELGGYFLITDKDQDLPVRPKELYDGALPSANSVALSNLLSIARLTGDHYWQERADKLIRAFSSPVSKQPLAYTHFLNGLDMAMQPV